MRVEREERGRVGRDKKRKRGRQEKERENEKNELVKKRKKWVTRGKERSERIGVIEQKTTSKRKRKTRE